jgi:hypothetical protein
MRNNGGIFFNVLTSFVIAFLLIKLLTYLMFSGVGGYFENKSNLINYTVYSPTLPDSPNWTRLSVLSMYSSYIIVPFLLGIVSWTIFSKLKRSYTAYKIPAFMIAYTSVNLFFGSIVAGIVDGFGFYHFLNWLHFGEVLQLGLIIIMSYFSLLFSMLLVRQFPVICPSRNILNRKYRRTFTMVSLGASMLVGIIFIHAFYLETLIIYELIESLFLIIPVLTIFIPRKKLGVTMVREQSTRKFRWEWMIFAIVFLIMFVSGAI